MQQQKMLIIYQNKEYNRTRKTTFQPSTPTKSFAPPPLADMSANNVGFLTAPLRYITSFLKTTKS